MFRSTAGEIFNEVSGNYNEFERGGGFHRLKRRLQRGELLRHSGEDTKKPSRRRDIKRQATIDPWSQYCDKVAMLSACRALAENREKIS